MNIIIRSKNKARYRALGSDLYTAHGFRRLSVGSPGPLFERTGYFECWLTTSGSLLNIYF